MGEQGWVKGEVRAGRARIKVNYLVLSYLCLVHLVAASAFLLPIRPGLIALAVFTYFFIGFSTTMGCTAF